MSAQSLVNSQKLEDKLYLNESQATGPSSEQESDSYLPSSSVVVKIHQGSGILPFPFLGIYKCTGKLDPIVNVVTAATPVKGAFAVLGTSFLLWVTGAGL